MMKLSSSISVKRGVELLFNHLPSQQPAPLEQIEINNVLHDTSLIVICFVRVMLCNPIISVFQRERFAFRSLCKDTSN